MKRYHRYPLYAVMLLGLLAFYGSVARVSAQESAISVPQSQAQITLSFAPVVKSVTPAVVNIYTKRIVREKARMSPFANDPLFQRFFGEEFAAPAPVRERVERSLGSGVIIDPDGTVVTSNHVIKGAQAITVVLSDRRELDATVTKTDPQTDLAFLKVDADEKLPALSLRDSDTLEVGELVLAVGNPFGVGQTVTQGIISGLARGAGSVSDYQSFIQTDAAINPGNSGGALVDLQGQLIGINTAIYSTSGGSLGVGFAIPSNLVRSVQASKVDGNRILRPWIGLHTQNMTQEIAESIGLKVPAGALVRKVTPGGPADKAGIRAGDVIVGANNADIADERGLGYRISTSAIGDVMKLAVLRKGDRIEIPVTLVTPPAGADKVTLKGNHPLSGVTIAELSPDMAAQLDLPDGANTGVIVTDVQLKSGQPAIVQPGDILERINGKSIETTDDVKAALAKGGRAWDIVLRRGAQRMTLSIR